MGKKNSDDFGGSLERALVFDLFGDQSTPMEKAKAKLFEAKAESLDKEKLSKQRIKLSKHLEKEHPDWSQKKLQKHVDWLLS